MAGEAVAYVQVAPAGVAKGPRARLVASSQLPVHHGSFVAYAHTSELLGRSAKHASTFIVAMKIRTICPHCQRSLVADDSKGGKPASCPSCGGMMEIPFGGWSLARYWIAKFAIWFVTPQVLAVAGGGFAARDIVYIAWALLSLYPSIQRAVNIGHRWQVGFVGLIPGAVFYFGFTPTGAAKKRRRKKPKGKMAKPV